MRRKRRLAPAGAAAAADVVTGADAVVAADPSAATAGAPGAGRRHPPVASVAAARSSAPAEHLTSGLGRRQDLDVGRFLLARLGRLLVAGGLLQLDVELERLCAALAARPVRSADHPLVRLVAVLLDRD